MKVSLCIGITALALAANTATAKAVVVDQTISEEEVLAAQQGWCKALVDIGATYDKSGQGAAKDMAAAVIDAAYGYEMGAVLFKPTLTVNPQTFRTTREGALSYFVGGDSNFPKDSGFALKGWQKCEQENAAIFINGDTATTMGKVRFTDKENKITTVDKTWTFTKDDEGQLRIMVHHSSLEYSAP